MVDTAKLQINRVFVAGHLGMVGSAIIKQLRKEPSNEIITASREELDLLNQQAVEKFIQEHKPDQIYLAAAKVGGIHANNEYPAEFIYQNLVIQTNIIHAAHLSNVPKLLFLGSSCIYPKGSPQPMSEACLLTGVLEETNEPYAVAKIAGIKLCESYNRQYGRDYRSVMPTNLYGPGDNFHHENSHVIPALIRRFHEAKVTKIPSVTAWGSGRPKREFLHVDDMAAGSIFVMNLSVDMHNTHITQMNSHINIGTGLDCTIQELTETVSKVVGFNGDILWDASKPDGTERKLLDVARLKTMGWQAQINLEQGLQDTYDWFLENLETIRS